MRNTWGVLSNELYHVNLVQYSVNERINTVTKKEDKQKQIFKF